MNLALGCFTAFTAVFLESAMNKLITFALVLGLPEHFLFFVLFTHRNFFSTVRQTVEFNT